MPTRASIKSTLIDDENVDGHGGKASTSCRRSTRSAARNDAPATRGEGNGGGAAASSSGGRAHNSSGGDPGCASKRPRAKPAESLQQVLHRSRSHRPRAAAASGASSSNPSIVAAAKASGSNKRKADADKQVRWWYTKPVPPRPQHLDEFSFHLCVARVSTRAAAW